MFHVIMLVLVMTDDPPKSKQTPSKIVSILAISDSHSLHDQYDISEFPPADILVHAGDFTLNKQPQQINGFRDFLQKLPHKHKIVIPGNHERGFYDPPIKEWEKQEVENQKRWLEEDCKFCEMECFEVMGVNFLTVPKGPEYFDWKFDYMPEQGKQIIDHYKGKIDVLITHYPPFGILDEVYSRDHTGSRGLLNFVTQIRPKAHIFGHIHQSYGHVCQDGIDFYNVSSCDEEYELVNQPVRIQVQRE